MPTLLADALPADCMTGTFNSHGVIPLAITILGLLLAIYSLAKAFHFLREESEAKRTHTTPPDRHKAKAWLLGLWLLAPPAWLFVEDIFLYRAFGKPACFDFFQHAQQLVTNGWIVTAAALTLLYFGKELFGKE